MDCKETGKRIFELRKAHGMTQQQLAEALSVTNKAVSKWETGEGLPDISVLPLLARALNVSIDYLLCGDDGRNDYAAEKRMESSRAALLAHGALLVLLLFAVLRPSLGIASLLDAGALVVIVGVSPLISLLLLRLRHSDGFFHALCFGGLPAAGIIGFCWYTVEFMLRGEWYLGYKITFIPPLYAVFFSLLILTLHLHRQKTKNIRSAN